jgi:predicted Zn finger-like uncharacterized protein
MKTRISCPGCEATLNVPAAVAGKKVRCPTCSTTFIAPSSEEVPQSEAPLTEDPIPRRRSPAPPPSSREDDADEERRVPRRRDDDDDDGRDDDDDRPRRRRRRRSRPSSDGGGGGVAALALGIVSIVCAFIATFFCPIGFALLGLTFGIIAVCLPNPSGGFSAGRICGIIGIIMSITCGIVGVIFGVMVVAAMQHGGGF